MPGPVQGVKGSGIAAAVADIPAVAWIQSLAQELPCAVGVAIKRDQKKKKKRKCDKLDLSYAAIENVNSGKWFGSFFKKKKYPAKALWTFILQK